jgi:hypothetical protein
LSPLGQPLARPGQTTPVRGRLARPPALLALLPFAACLASGVHTAGAQAVSDIDDEALTLPGGVVRLSAAESDTRYDSRYGSGGLQSLGSYLTLDSLGPSQLPILAPLQSSLRSLTGDASMGVSLGGTEVTSSVRVSVTPIGLDVGLTRRITLHAIVPIVRTHNEILFQPNVNGTGNVGLNPALALGPALRADTVLYGDFARSAAGLQSALAACTANPASASYCASLDAQRATVDQLIAQSSSFASGLSQVYGGDGRLPFPVVPVGNSPALAAINQRMQAFASRFAHFDSLTGGQQIIPSQGPAGAPPLGLGDAQTLLTTDAMGLGYDSLQSVDRVGLGDIEVGATALILDSFHGHDSARVHPSGFNYRFAVTGLFRLGTGTPNPPNALVGVGTGTGANAVEVHAATDILIGPHFWFSLVARGTQPMMDQISARIPLGLGDEFSPLFTQQMVSRTLGRTLDFEVNPRYSITDFVGLVGEYRYITHSADQYSGTFSFDSAATGFGPVALNANILGVGTATTEHQWGIGITFSTVAAATRHASRLPFDITYFHYQTVTGYAGEFGSLPRVGYDEVRARIYVRLLGHGGAFKH